MPRHASLRCDEAAHLAHPRPFDQDDPRNLGPPATGKDTLPVACTTGRISNGTDSGRLAGSHADVVARHR